MRSPAADAELRFQRACGLRDALRAHHSRARIRKNGWPARRCKGGVAFDQIGEVHSSVSPRS